MIRRDFEGFVSVMRVLEFVKYDEKSLQNVVRLLSKAGGPGQELSKQVIESSRTAGKLLVLSESDKCIIKRKKETTDRSNRC